MITRLLRRRRDISRLPGSTARPPAHGDAGPALAEAVGRQEEEEHCGQSRAEEEGRQMAALLASKPHAGRSSPSWNCMQHGGKLKLYMLMLSLSLPTFRMVSTSTVYRVDIFSGRGLICSHMPPNLLVVFREHVSLCLCRFYGRTGRRTWTFNLSHNELTRNCRPVVNHAICTHACAYGW